VTPATATRTCKWCPEEVTSTNPDVDFCKWCFYSGRWAEELHGKLIDELRDIPGIGNVGVDHTGGGCFALYIGLPGDAWMYATEEHGFAVPDTEDGPWLLGHYRDEDDCDGEIVAEGVGRDELIAHVREVAAR
jgi:hypothetical protein